MKRLKFAEESLNLAFALGNVKIIIKKHLCLTEQIIHKVSFSFANRDTIAVQ